MDAETFERKIRETQTVNESNEYFAVTLTGGEDGKMRISTQTHFVRYTDTKPRRELRAPSEIIPEHMISIWNSWKQPYIVVNTPDDLSFFIAIGGNALVEKKLAGGHMLGLGEAKAVVPDGLVGHRNLLGLPAENLNRAPNPKLRMKILKRDDYRCKVCGRRATDNSDIQLHVHHIRPWEQGGITDEKNLIVLCHTCHLGLDPHFEWNLFELIGGGISSLDVEGENQEHFDGVAKYRENFLAKVRKIRSGKAAKTKKKKTRAVRPTAKSPSDCT